MVTFNKESLWEAVLAELQLSLSGANFQTWFKGRTTILSLDKNIIEIGCSSPYTKVWIEERYLGKIKEIIDRLTGASNTLVFTNAFPSSAPKVKKRAGDQVTVPLFEEVASPSISMSLEAANINQKYSFANFIIGQSNQLAYAVAKTVAEAPYERYNPLLIYGGVGVGKTHLIQALIQAILLRRSNVKALYCSSETFTNDMVAAIQKRQTIDFRSKYRNIDFLAVDDIQFIAGRESTQEEFFHTFNHLYSKGKQIILSCDQDPSGLANLQDRLKNRFTGGMVAKIDTPDLELREAILLSKAKSQGLEIDFSTIRVLAQNLGPSVRELEGGLVKLAAVSRLVGKKVDLELAGTVIGLEKNSVKKSAPDVIRETASYFSLPVSDLNSKRRSHEFVFPRQVTMYLLRSVLKLPYKQIAQNLGGRDHTTVIYSVNKVENLVEKDVEIARLIGELKEKIFQG